MDKFPTNEIGRASLPYEEDVYGFSNFDVDENQDYNPEIILSERLPE